jgi:hypothetical protein
MRKKATGYALLVAIGLSSLFSCKDKTNNDKYFYNALRDTVAPKIQINVPTTGALYNFGDDIHVIGTVTDLEVTNKSGKLKSLSLDIYQYNPANGMIVKSLMERDPNVDAKSGYTFSEKYTSAVGQPATIYCKLMVTAMDYSTRVSQDSVLFSITP